MDPIEKIAAGVGMTLLLVWPAVLLLLFRRWLRRWWLAGIAFVHLFPIITFVVAGTIFYALAYHHVVVRGDTSVPDQEGLSIPQYLNQTAVFCGFYSVLIAGIGFLMSLPLLVGWRVLHRRSFELVTRTLPSEQPE